MIKGTERDQGSKGVEGIKEARKRKPKCKRRKYHCTGQGFRPQGVGELKERTRGIS